MTAPVLPGAAPASYGGGPHGVLILHGFTGSPQSMRPLAEAVAAAGYTVELPLLPGHGTSLDDMIPTRWSDWSQAAEVAYTGLAARCDKVAVAGLSMGGTLATWLAARHPQVGALVTVNATVEPGSVLADIGRQLLAEGTEVFAAIGSDIAKPGVSELAYEGTPVAAMISMAEAIDELAPLIPEIRCPALVFTSASDHVVPTSAGDYLAANLSGPVERITLERSFHVATLDFDAEEIQARTVEFLGKVLGG